MKDATREKLAYVSHGLVALMFWPYIVRALPPPTGELSKIGLVWYLAALAVLVIPMILIVVAFIAGFFFKPTRILSILMPLMLYGALGWEYETAHRYALLMLPYAVLSPIIVIRWMYQRTSSGI